MAHSNVLGLDWEAEAESWLDAWRLRCQTGFLANGGCQSYPLYTASKYQVYSDWLFASFLPASQTWNWDIAFLS